MDVFNNTNKSKKFILIVIAIILFSFAIPKQVMAIDLDLKDNISDFLFWIERGIIRVTNNIFCDERHKYEYVKDSADSDSTKVYISPESIIKGKFAILNPNIFEDISNPYVDSKPENDEYYDTSVVNADGSLGDSALGAMIEGRKELRNTVASWYYALRNLAIIALLSILVYVGIRMIISTLSQDKAKYKMMLKDWLVALCLVMVMHYLMIGTLKISSSITDAIGRSGKNSMLMQNIMTKIQLINNSDEKENQIYLIEKDGQVEEVKEGEGGELYTIGDAFAYELVLLGVIGYTLIFAIKYLLRMITIVFLVLVAPITAITYPIDKIADGKAQAFNTWLQEFIYEVIIQPFHLLIYVVLIGSATTLASTNILYSIMCFAVMIPAEKFIKQMFGFKDKLGSPIGAFAGGAMASQLISKAFSGGGSKVESSPKVEGKSESDNSFRENKSKPGLPDADSGTGSRTQYGNNDDENNSHTTTNELPEDDNITELDDDSQQSDSFNNPEDGDFEIDDNFQQLDTLNDSDGNDSTVTPGGGASAAAAYQESNNPVRDAEIAALDEEYAEGGMDRLNYEARKQDILDKHNGINWHKDLTQEQIDEAKAERIKPGTQEYNQYLREHGIDPNKSTTEHGTTRKETEGEEVPESEKIEERNINDENVEESPKEVEEPSGEEIEESPKEVEEPSEEEMVEPSEEEPVEPNTTGIYTPSPHISEFKSKKDKIRSNISNNSSKISNATNALREHRDKKLMAKYGTKNRAKTLGIYAGRKAAKYGKKAIKGATTLAGAAALGLVGAMFGQGKAGLAAGATFGAKVGNGVNNKLSSAYKTTKEYGKEAVYATKDEDKRRQQKVKEMMRTPDQIEKASRSFSKRNNGKIANTQELNQELEERARFKETGLTDNQIDDAMEIYKNNISEMGDEKAFAMSVKAAELGSRLKATDFEDSKKVGNTYESMMKEYEALGVNQDLADENVRAIIQNAASTQGIKNPALPMPSRKEAYKQDKSNIEKARKSYANRHLNEEGKKIKPNTQQLNHELEMGYNLRKAGISEDYRDKFFDEYITNDDARFEAKETLKEELGREATEEEVDNELERRFEIKIKAGMIADKKNEDGTEKSEDQVKEEEKKLEKDLTAHIKEAQSFIKTQNNIEKPSNGQVFKEVKQRLTVKDSYHISGDSVKDINDKITEIRKDEQKFIKNSKDKEGARAVLNVQRQEADKQIKQAQEKYKRDPEKTRKIEQAKKEQITKARYQREFLGSYSMNEMQSNDEMKKADKRINKKLTKELKEIGQNTYSEEFKEKFAVDIINSSRKMVGIDTEYRRNI